MRNGRTTRRARCWNFPLFLVLSGCASFGSTTSGGDGAFSGSSAPRATREPTVIGGGLIGPGGGGEAEAENLASQNCERYQLRAEVEGIVTEGGSVYLRYSCQ